MSRHVNTNRSEKDIELLISTRKGQARFSILGIGPIGHDEDENYTFDTSLIYVLLVFFGFFGFFIYLFNSIQYNLTTSTFSRITL